MAMCLNKTGKDLVDEGCGLLRAQKGSARFKPPSEQCRHHSFEAQLIPPFHLAVPSSLLLSPCNACHKTHLHGMKTRDSGRLPPSALKSGSIADRASKSSEHDHKAATLTLAFAESCAQEESQRFGFSGLEDSPLKAASENIRCPG